MTDGLDVLVEATRKLQVEKLLRERDIHFEVSTEKSSPTYYPSPPQSPRRQISPRASAGSRYTRQRLHPFPKRVLDWKNYYPLKLIYDFMTDLEIQYPSTCSVLTIGITVEGREIKMLKISNSDASNTGVWLDGAVHAREWISVSVVTYIANYIARNFANLPNSVTNKDWFFVPVLNPDGYEFTHTTDRMWRKNRYIMGSIPFGVDLNRNFGHHWGKMMEYSSPDPAHLNYRGPEPFSEPEACAVKDFILNSGIPFKIFISYHAYSEAITFPWCYTSEPCSDYVKLLEGATIIAKAIYTSTGRMYKVGSFKDIMYYACGTSIDWSYGTAQIPYTYLVELRSKEHKFLLPKEEILDCCKENLSGILALASFADTGSEKLSNCIIIPKKIR